MSDSMADSRSIPKRRFLIYTLALLISVIAYIDRIAISMGAPSIAHEFHLSPVQLGTLLSSFFWTYTLCLVPLGMLTDRFGVRNTLACCLGLWSLMTVATGLAGSYTLLLLSRFGVGIGESGATPSYGRLMREWSPRSERGIAATFVAGAGSYLGPAIGAALLGFLVGTVGWRGGLYVAGVLSAAFLIPWLIWYRVPEKAQWLDPRECNFIVDERAPAPSGRISSMAMLLSSRSMWAIALTHGCSIYSQYFYLTWLPSYLAKSRGLTIMHAGLFIAVPYLVAAVVVLMLGALSDRLTGANGVSRGQRRWLIIGLELSSAVVFLVPFVSSTPLMLLLMTVSLCALAGTVSLHFALLHDLLINPADSGTAISLMTLGGNVFGLAAPIVTGYVIQTTNSYSWAFGIAGLLLMLGAVLLALFAGKPIGTEITVMEPKSAAPAGMSEFLTRPH